MAYNYVNPEGLEHLITGIKNKFVQKQTGKGLSANDFTNILKQKLDGIETGAQVNTVDSVNSKTGDIVITSDDIEFLSSVTGATPTTVRAIIDDVIANDIAQDTEIGKKANTTYVDSQLGGKVDTVTGKGLSTQDFTTALRDKLNAIEAGAETNIIEVIKRNGTNLIVTDKEVDISVPTKFSELTNDKNFKTESEIKTLINQLGKLKKEIVESLPAVGTADDNTMYLVASDNGFAEWMVIEGVWEKLGDTSHIDLTGYVKKVDLVPITTDEIDAMWLV